MQQLIASYLFQHKYCSIPNLGTLYLIDTPASAEFGEQKITAPKPIISFSHSVLNELSLQAFVAAEKKLSNNDASIMINKFSNEVNDLQLGKAMEMLSIGKFYKNEESLIAFIPLEIAEDFLPDVHAERVVHPNDSHTMLVGEKETNTAAMAEYLEEDVPLKKAKWWVFAVVVAVLSIGTIIYKAIEVKKDSFFGMSQKVVPQAADSTYKILP